MGPKVSTFATVPSFQRDFQGAISSWLETGICQKMENEITTSQAFRGHFEESFWTRRNVHGNRPLTVYHVLPSFMVLGFGLIPSIIIFILESLLCLNKKKIIGEPIPENHISQQEYGTGTNPRATVMDEDNNDTIMAMAEIHESLSMEL